MLTKEIAESIWKYDPDTGYFFWKISPKYDVFVGDRAGNFDGKYWRLAYKQKNYKASRVAWLMVTGSWPESQIDHINGNKTDDRFKNLRSATNAQNCRNRSRRDNKLGTKGVWRSAKRCKYEFTSSIQIDGKRIYLGTFSTIHEAKLAYDKAAKQVHGEFARL